jgi:hypothetical protein
MFNFVPSALRRCRSLFALSFLAAGVETAPSQEAFYTSPPGSMPGEAGSIFRKEAIAAPDGMSAFRVLYRFRGLWDQPIAVSGLVIFPD